MTAHGAARRGAAAAVALAAGLAGLVALAAGLGGALPAPAVAEVPAQLRADGTLRIAYIGGSITEGAFSSTPQNSYASLVTAWLRTRFAHVEARNIGVGGTGSDFAAYRLERDLGRFAPDVAILEFTVNDAGRPRADILAHIDAILHDLRARNPRVRLLYVSVTDASEEASRRQGQPLPVIQTGMDVARMAGLPVVDAGAGLWAKVAAGAKASDFLVDAVHPNDAGHRLYFEQVRAALEPLLAAPVRSGGRGGGLVGRSRLDTARIVPASAASSACRAETLPIRYMDPALRCDPGKGFTFRFSGTTVGMVRAVVRDGGRLRCTLDGADPRRFDFFDDAALIYDRPAPAFAYRDLPPGRHTLACTATDEPVESPRGRSRGHRVAIGGFLVSDARPITLP